MALVTCPDCGKQISSAAISCIECGHPMRASDAPVVIEQTGKQYKLWMLVGICMAIGGFFLVGLIGAVPGLVICVAGILLFIGSMFGAWWQHG